MKHTKGPWEYKKATAERNEDQEEDCIIYCKDKNGTTHIHIAETFQYQNDNYNKSDGTSIANAKLIATAPELLECCKRALEIVEGENYDYTAKHLKQAIAKAEGELK